MVRQVLLGMLVLVGGPAMAQTTGGVLFPHNDACYSRTYTTAHLAAHPVQRVAAVSLSPEPSFSTDDLLALRITIALRRPPQPYSGVAYCIDAGQEVRCSVEGDGGGFTLTRRADDLLLTVERDGIGLDGDNDFMTISGTDGDDRAFLMPPAPAGRCH